MKKWFKTIIQVFVLALILLIPGIQAQAGTITSLTVTAGNNTFTVSGAAGEGVLSVVIFVYDSTGENLLQMESVMVDSSHAYTDTFEVSEGSYLVKVADYEGGAFSEKNVTVDPAGEGDKPSGSDEGDKPADTVEWKEEDGVKYWYEDGVKQGTQGRGKEIYDPESNAWYFLDAADGGRMAVSKDVAQPTDWDAYNADPDGYGLDNSKWKWVRYDENGHMIKGWDNNENGVYYFDPITGQMAKGSVEIDNKACYFDEVTGVGADVKWITLDGVEYWYEGGVRQGYEKGNEAYRGKEIYDPDTNAWYWLDNIDGGKKAVSKDVYQESLAGDWGDMTNEAGEKIGKWVRYDAQGHMIKGWSADHKYYFDPVFGTMAKGVAIIDGKTYNFDKETGILK